MPNSPTEPLLVRPAQTKDIQQIYNLRVPFMEAGILLTKTLQQVEDDIERTAVCLSNESLIGVSTYFDYGNRLFELRGLAVDPAFQRRGIGSRLVGQLIELIRLNTTPGEVHLFALTYQPAFFVSLGWKTANMESFPDKIFLDCGRCLKKDNCQEVAVDITISI